MRAVPPEQATPAQRWFGLALEDLAAARALLADGSIALRIVGFLSQQAVAKALKAGLFAARLPAPKVHGLQQLLVAAWRATLLWSTRTISMCSTPGISTGATLRTSPSSLQARPRSFS
jgi:hypothetical protein